MAGEVKRSGPRPGRSSHELAQCEQEGFEQTPDHILLTKRHEPNPVHSGGGPSFPRQDPIAASGKNELGRANCVSRGNYRAKAAA